MVRTDEKLDRSFRKGDGWNAHTAENFSVSKRDDKGKKIVQSLSGRERNKLFISQSAQSFQDISALSGLDSIADGRAFALFDYNKDGWQDLVLVNSNAPTFEVFRNELKSKASNHHQIGFRLVGGNKSATPTTDLSNRDAFGAVVTVYTGGKQFLRELRCGEGLSAQNSQTILIGLGKNDQVDSVKIAWPSGKKQTLTGLEAGMIHTIDELGGHKSEPFQQVATGPRIVRKDSVTRLSVTGVLKEKPIVYITTASWCPACKKALPQVTYLTDRLGDQISFYGLPIDPKEKPEDLELYQKNFRPSYQLLNPLEAFHRASASSIVQAALGSNILPATIVTDSEGEVLSIFAGVPTVSELLNVIPKEK